PARVEYLTGTGKQAYGIAVSWPAVEVLSQVSPGVATMLQRTNRLNWRVDLVPVAAPTYRLSPTLLFWLALGLAGACVLAAARLARRWYATLRPPPAAIVPSEPATTLDPALAVPPYAPRPG